MKDSDTPMPDPDIVSPSGFGTKEFLSPTAKLVTLAERFFVYPSRKGVLSKEIVAWSRKRVGSIVFFPAIPDAETLGDLYRRALWYFGPVQERFGKVVLPVTFDWNGKIEIPDYLSPDAPSASRRHEEFEVRRTGSFKDGQKLIADADIVMVWDSKFWDPPESLKEYGVFRRAGRTFFNVDRNRFSREASSWLDVPRLLGACAQPVINECRAKFRTLSDKLGGAQRAYVFGTGPSLAELDQLELGDGIRVVSNSVVRNVELMTKLNPAIVCCGDPVFHAGCSNYAADFRGYLLEAMEKFPIYAIVPITHYPYYRQIFPDEIFDRIIGVPIGKLGHFNFNLEKEFKVQQTGNILTMLMLPVAATIVREVRVAGCDGRADKGQNYFWSHHSPSQIEERLDDAKLAHPGFFKISYTDYYDQHCEMLESLFRSGEYQGKIFRNVTTSHIPALKSRTLRLDQQGDPISALKKPVIYTFYSTLVGKAQQDEMALLELWKESWQAMGWEPIVLDESDVRFDDEAMAMASAFTKLPSINKKNLDYCCYLRWLAVAQAGGGFMCDYDVINYGFVPRDAGELTLYERSVPCLVSGTAAEFMRVARLFAAYQPKRSDKLGSRAHVSDMMILSTNPWMFKTAAGCGEFGRPGWEEAPAVHFANFSMKPHGYMPRHAHIPKIRPLPVEVPG